MCIVCCSLRVVCRLWFVIGCFVSVAGCLFDFDVWLLLLVVGGWSLFFAGCVLLLALFDVVRGSLIVC